MSVPRSVSRLFPNVEEVRNSATSVEISVTDNDCKTGRKKAPSECALAKAAKRQYKVDGAIIGMCYSYLIKGRQATRFKTPETVAREITSFDRHHDFAPGDYKLSKCSPSINNGRKAKHSGSRRVNRIVHTHTARVRVMEK